MPPVLIRPRMPGDAHVLIVVAAVIERDGHFLVTRRLKGTHLADFWEFPGGKCEPHETHEACLARELIEELDAQAEIGAEILSTEHAYPDRSVRLHFLSCRLLTNPRPMLGQEMRWVSRAELRSLPFPEADCDLINMLATK
jgi:8-oxo-dGTP diphosphatase